MAGIIAVMCPVAQIRLNSIKPEYIFRYFGYDDAHEPSPMATSIIEEESAWLLANAHPKGVYDIFTCEFTGRRTTVVGNKELESRVLRLHLDGSIYVAVLAVTMGANVDERISMLMEQRHRAQSYILNGIASAAADCAADAVEEEIRGIVSSGNAGEITGCPDCEIDPAWKMTLRFSPGYADLILENQAAIFELIKPDRIGLKLTKSSLMVPLKSITALIGIGPEVNDEAYPCDICDRCNITECRFIED